MFSPLFFEALPRHSWTRQCRPPLELASFQTLACFTISWSRLKNNSLHSRPAWTCLVRKSTFIPAPRIRPDSPSPRPPDLQATNLVLHFRELIPLNATSPKAQPAEKPSAACSDANGSPPPQPATRHHFFDTSEEGFEVYRALKSGRPFTA